MHRASATAKSREKTHEDKLLAHELLDGYEKRIKILEATDAEKMKETMLKELDKEKERRFKELDKEEKRRREELEQQFREEFDKCHFPLRDKEQGHRDGQGGEGQGRAGYGDMARQL
eukprot:gene21243-28159_t